MTTIITGGRVVTPEGILDGFDIIIEDETIAAIRPAGLPAADAVTVDASGHWVLPGLIDIHSDFIENMVVPRPTSIMKLDLALREAERVLATHGITTMYHSISIISDLHAFSVQTRAPELTRRLIDAIAASAERAHMIHHRFHARFEIDSHDRVPELKEYIEAGRVHLLSIMDHTPGQGQFRDMAIYKATMKAWRKLDDHAVEQLVLDVQNRPMMDYRDVVELTDVAHRHGVAVASHDDDTVEKLDLVAGFGSQISEFPITIEVAREARRRGMHTAAGAPNVLLGGSHSGNLSAADAIAEGVVDVLCSDYYPAALLHAAFRLHRQQKLPFHEMVNLVTINPARAAGIDRQTGSIETGKRADLILVRELNDGPEPFPAVSDVFVSGRHVLSTRYREAP